MTKTKLRTYLDSRGITLKYIAIGLNWSYMKTHRVVSGKQKLKVDEAKDIAALIGCNLCDIV